MADSLYGEPRADAVFLKSMRNLSGAKVASAREVVVEVAAVLMMEVALSS
jgi:hypothetical protein